MWPAVTARDRTENTATIAAHFHPSFPVVLDPGVRRLGSIGCLSSHREGSCAQVGAGKMVTWSPEGSLREDLEESHRVFQILLHS